MNKKKKIRDFNALTRDIAIILNQVLESAGVAKIRVVGFVRKKLLTYFEMLIVPHALQCVDGCFLAHLSTRCSR